LPSHADREDDRECLDGLDQGGEKGGDRGDQELHQ
jgi:hypothetical protein